MHTTNPLLLTGIALASLACGIPQPPTPGPDAATAEPRADAAADRMADTAVPTDAPAANDSATLPPQGDPLPAWDAATEAHVRELLARGRARGNRHDVVAKLGDSITESRAFLYECGDGHFHPGAHTELVPTVAYFTRRALDADGFNAFTRGSQAATGGWSVADALEGDGTSVPIATELAAIRPAWAVVMFGTNDMERVSVETYREQMGRALDLIEAEGVVPLLSTVPPRTDSAEMAARVAPFNAAIRALAQARHVPWMDYWAALARVPGHGLSPDGVHPSVYRKGEMRTCDASDEAVQHGYNARNLLTIRALARLRAYE